MKVSIITAVYNNAETVADAVESVRSQTHNNIEHIVIDGGSDDGTLQVLEQYQSDLAELVSEPDDGIYDAMNKGIARAGGEIVGLLNADDYYRHDRVIERVVSEFQKQQADAVYGDLQYVDPGDGKVLRHWEAGSFDPSKFERGWMPPHPTFFVRRKAYDRHGTFREDLNIAADYELVLRLLYRHGLQAAYIPEVLVQMRAGGASNNGLRSRFTTFWQDYKAWRMNGLGIWSGLRAQVLKRLGKVGQFVSR